jgi:hypothetical protein
MPGRVIDPNPKSGESTMVDLPGYTFERLRRVREALKQRFLLVPSQCCIPNRLPNITEMLESPPFFSYRANLFHLLEVLPPTQLRSSPKHLRNSHAAILATNQTESFVQRHTNLRDLFWTVAPGCLPF